METKKDTPLYPGAVLWDCSSLLCPKTHQGSSNADQGLLAL